MPLSKEEIYNIISTEVFSFTQQKTTNAKQQWLKERAIFNVPCIVLSNNQSFYDYLHDDAGKLCVCGKECKFLGFRNSKIVKGSYSKFCSKKCLHSWRSNNMSGDNNNYHKVSKTRQLEIGKENGIRLKKMIADGTFTPVVTNSWARSRCIVNIERDLKQYQIKCRSSWDAYFQLKHPGFIYEKVRIPYQFNDKISTYIVDFVDEKNKTIYEIKPNGFRESERNLSKFKAAEDWCKTNDFKFKIIGNNWFSKNYDEFLLEDQPDELKIKRLLKQFRLI